MSPATSWAARVVWTAALGLGGPRALEAGAVEVPSPERAEHPGAADAPASSPRTYSDEAGF
jgi:hypothetical protein